VNGGDGTECRRLGMGGDNSKELRHKDKGILFSTRAEMGVGSEYDRDSASRGGNTGERQAEVGGMSTMESRGGDGTRDDLLDEGAILTVDSMSGSEGDKSRVSTRVDTGEVGSEGEHEGVAENCEGMGASKADGEGDGWRPM
jgi:hypothetical protein